MAIDRIGPQGPQANDPRKAAAAGQGQRVTPGSNGSQRTSGASASIPDQVQISAEAVELSAREDIPRGELPASRLIEISQRIGSGFYNQPDVVDATARGLLAELGRPERA